MKKIFNAVLILTLVVLPLPVVQAQTRGVAVRVKGSNGQTKEVRLYDGSFALVIGNSRYTNGWGPLDGVPGDVIAVSGILKEQGFVVETAENLTGEQFTTRVGKFIRDHGFEPNNRLLIYYAGHGHTLKSTGDGRELGYIVPADAPLPKKDERGFIQTAIPMDDILGFAKKIQSKHALFIFDSCFSGKLVSRSTIVPPPVILENVAFPVRQFITAGSANQEVPDESIFRRSFVRALEGEADRNHDGYITGTELAEYLKEKVTNYSNRSQTPQYGKINDVELDKGDFVFLSGARSDSVQNGPSPVASTGEAAFWKTIENSTDEKEFDNYLSKSKNREFSGAYQAAAELKLYRIMKARASAAWPKLQHRLAIQEKYYALYFSFEDGILTEPVQLLSGRKENGMLADYGYVDETGKLFIPHKYPFARRFSEGLAAVRIGDKFGYIDKTDRVVIPPKFDDADPFSEGLAVFAIKSGSQDYYGKRGVIDKTGREVVPAKYDHILPFSGGFARVQIYNAKGTKNGYIDKTGREITPIKYEDPYSSDFSEGLAAVEFGGKCGFIDTTGREVIPLKYDQVSSFSEGLAAVRLGDKWGFINKSGGEIIPLKYSWALSFSEGLAGVRLDDKWGYIDNAGRVVIPIKLEGQASEFRYGFTDVVIEGKYAIIDKTGRVVVPPKYNLNGYGGFVQEGLFVAELNGKKGFVDIYGHEFFDF